MKKCYIVFFLLLTICSIYITYTVAFAQDGQKNDLSEPLNELPSNSSVESLENLFDEVTDKLSEMSDKLLIESPIESSGESSSESSGQSSSESPSESSGQSSSETVIELIDDFLNNREDSIWSKGIHPELSDSEYAPWLIKLSVSNENYPELRDLIFQFFDEAIAEVKPRGVYFSISFIEENNISKKRLSWSREIDFNKEVESNKLSIPITFLVGKMLINYGNLECFGDEAEIDKFLTRFKIKIDSDDARKKIASGLGVNTNF